MEASIFSQFTAICILKTDAFNLVSETNSFKHLHDTVSKFLNQKKTFNDSFLVVMIQGIETMILIDNSANEAIDFLLQLLLSSEIAESERILLLLLAKKHISPVKLFLLAQKRLIDFVSLILEKHITEERYIISILQLLDCIISSLTTSCEVLLLMYTSLHLLAEIDATYFEIRELSTAEVRSLMEYGGTEFKKQTLSAFVNQQLRSSYPNCREYGYKITGMIAARCFNLLGEKVITQLLVKQVLKEVPRNRLVIINLLWDILYIWPEYLMQLLVLPKSEREVQGVPENTWDLLAELWKNSSGTINEIDKININIRSSTFLFAARIVAARRLPDLQINASIIRDMLVSLLIRPSIEKIVMVKVCEVHHQMLDKENSIAISGSNRKKMENNKKENYKKDKDKSENAMSEFQNIKNAAKLDIKDLKDEDATDFNVISKLLVEGSTKRAFSGHSLRTILVRTNTCFVTPCENAVKIMVELLSIILGKSVIMSQTDLEGRKSQYGWSVQASASLSYALNSSINSNVNFNINSSMNMPYFQKAMFLFFSLISDSLFYNDDCKMVVDYASCVSAAFNMWLRPLQIDKDLNNLSEDTIRNIHEIFTDVINSHENTAEEIL